MKLAFIGLSDCHYFSARNTIENIYNQKVTATEELLIETLMEELNPVVMDYR